MAQRVLDAIEECIKQIGTILEHHANSGHLDPLFLVKIVEHLHCAQNVASRSWFGNIETLNAMRILVTKSEKDEHEDAKRKQLHDNVSRLYDALYALFIAHYATLNMHPIRMPTMTCTLGELCMLMLATLDQMLWSVTDRVTCARLLSLCAEHFLVVRRVGLVVTTEDNVPIVKYSAKTLMQALYAIYMASPTLEYSAELERYTLLLFRRAAMLLSRPYTAEVHNVTALRAQVSSVAALRRADRQNGPSQLFRYSQQLLTDVSILVHSFGCMFDAAELLPRVDSPSTAHIKHDDMRALRRWLRAQASQYMDRFVQNNYVSMSLRAGEWEFFRRETPGQEATDHEVMRRYRHADFLRCMERALLPPFQIIEQELIDDGQFDRAPLSQPESVHLMLAVLIVVKQRLNAACGTLNADDYVVAANELNDSVDRLRRATHEPVLIVCCNRLQLYYDGKLHMFNNMLHSVLTWMLLVNERCNAHLGSMDVSALIDECLFSTETPQARLRRRAVVLPRQNGGVVGRMSEFGVY